MERGSTRRWQKFPKFIEYANDRISFKNNTEDTLQSSWSYAGRPIYFFRRSILRSQNRKIHLELPSTLVFQYRDSNTWIPDNVWEVLATHQGKFKLLLGAIITGHVEDVHMQWLQEHTGHLQVYLKRRDRHRGQHYYEGLAQDPLDGLYWELKRFLYLGGERRLRNCPGCQRYFVQPTARPQTYCDTKCRLKGDPSRRKANADINVDIGRS